MRIAVMGSGGIGGYLGARLAQAGEDVIFIARGSHLEAMQQKGLRVESPLGEIHLRHVTATETPADVGFVDIVVFAVKAYDTESAAAAIVPLVGPATRVVTLQNGVDSVDAVARVVPRSQVVGGTTYLAALIERPGVIVHLGSVTRVILGRRDDAMIEAFQTACAGTGGIDLETVDDIGQMLWTKFVTVSAFSGATSLMRANVGQIFADSQASIFLEQLRDEGAAVAAAAGHPMLDGYKEFVISLWQKLPSETRSSMANDLDRGKPIELSWLSGRMHALGNELGVPTPGHTAVYRALHLYADGAEPSRQARANRP
jgi:2-dehydropantoate 2-reductase